MAESNFGTIVDQYYSELNADICSYHSAGQVFEIVEEAADGKADIICATTLPCLQRLCYTLHSDLI